MLTFLPQTVHYVLFMDPQIPFFSNFFIKNGSHGTIYTFKNYFATVISAISFQFQQNKSYPNRPIVTLLIASLFIVTLLIASLFIIKMDSELSFILRHNLYPCALDFPRVHS